jgi:2-oxoglutarate ferredoxin oxidoreductase subunit gamma
MYFDSIIAGFGGQGVLLMGNLLAYAAMEEKKNVTYMPVYGVEMRGGTANCTVVISEKEIGSPIIHSPVTAVAMNLPSLLKFGPRVRKKGLLVVNTSLVPEKEIAVKGVDLLCVPALELAMEAGNDRLANMVILGALVERSGAVSRKALKKALYPALDVRYHKMIPANQKAMDVGAEFVINGGGV